MFKSKSLYNFLIRKIIHDQTNTRPQITRDITHEFVMFYKLTHTKNDKCRSIQSL